MPGRPASEATHGDPERLCHQRGGLPRISRVGTYLHDVLVFHPGWKSEALAQYLKQHRPERVVVVPPHSPHAFDVAPPKQLLVGLSAQKGGLRLPPAGSSRQGVCGGSQRVLLPHTVHNSYKGRDTL